MSTPCVATTSHTTIGLYIQWQLFCVKFANALAVCLLLVFWLAVVAASTASLDAFIVVAIFDVPIIWQRVSTPACWASLWRGICSSWPNSVISYQSQILQRCTGHEDSVGALLVLNARHKSWNGQHNFVILMRQLIYTPQPLHTTIQLLNS